MFSVLRDEERNLVKENLVFRKFFEVEGSPVEIS